MGKVPGYGFLGKGSRGKVAKRARARFGNLAKGMGSFAHEVEVGPIGAGGGCGMNGCGMNGCGMNGCDVHFGIPQETFSCIPNIIRTHNC